MGADARDLILALLNRNPKKRLGAGPNDADELKQHKFFTNVDWSKVASQSIPMPKPRQMKEIVEDEAAMAAFLKGE